MKNKKAVIYFWTVLSFAFVITALSERNKQHEGFSAAAGIDLQAAHIVLAEYGENDGVGNYAPFPLSEETLCSILLPTQLKRGKVQDSMPQRFFFIHLKLSDGTPSELIIGSNGEIIVGNPGNRKFWVDTGKASYQKLVDCFEKDGSKIS